MAKKMILFRADGNHIVGSGHVMRCLSIADASGLPCLFVLSDDNFKNMVAERGHSVYVMDTGGQPMEKEAPLLVNLINSYLPSALIMDSYSVTYPYLSSIHHACKNIFCNLMYVDDILAFPYPCDMLLNYNIYGYGKKAEYRAQYGHSGMEPPCFFLGPSYAPLRKEFQDLPVRMVKKNARDILICAGGADPGHILKCMADFISSNSQFTQFHFHFIVGAMNMDWGAIQHMLKHTTNVTLYYNTPNMQALMSNCDVAISAAGSTLYELCAAQAPTVTYTLANNQIPGAEEFSRRHILKYVGDVRSVGAARLSKELIYTALELAGNYDERARVAAFQKKLVDGKGAARIISALC